MRCCIDNAPRLSHLGIYSAQFRARNPAPVLLPRQASAWRECDGARLCPWTAPVDAERKARRTALMEGSAAVSRWGCGGDCCSRGRAGGAGGAVHGSRKGIGPLRVPKSGGWP